MRQLRSSSSSPKSLMGDFSTVSAFTRVLRSSTSCSPTESLPIFSLSVGKNTRRQKRNWSSYSSDSSSSCNDEEFQSSAQKESARRKAFAREFQWLTPASSPETSFSDDSKFVSSKSIFGFLEFPIEIHQHICAYLPTDKDVANYALICTKTSKSVSSSVWRQKFICAFDPIKHATAKELHDIYIQRRRLSQLYVEFDDLVHPLHSKCLHMLKALILQSNSHISINGEGKAKLIGHNHDFIREFMASSKARIMRSRGTNLVDAICKTESLFASSKLKSSRYPSSLVLVIQLCLLHLSLDPFICNARPPQFPESQAQVYKCYSEEPLFKGQNKSEINLPWLLHVANFFKFHLKQPGGEGMLSHMYGRLDESELPRQWRGKIKSGTQELGKRWKGAFAYLDSDDLAAIRDRGNRERDLLVDETNEGNNGFQDLTIFFDIEDHPELQFVDRLEEILQGKPVGPLYDLATGESSTPEVKDFFGLGYDGVHYHFNGRIHAMPAQQGIQGFQRVTMMKYLPDEQGHHGYGVTSGWAYEGCVLPGNEIMLGRWWRVEPDPALQEPAYSGPFIFWRVEGSAEDKLKDASAGVMFLESIGQFMV